MRRIKSLQIKLSSLAFTSLITLLLWSSGTAGSMAKEKLVPLFSLSLGKNQELLITTPGGTSIATLTAPVIAQPVQIETTNFQISYGKDLDQKWTAIIASDPTQPTALPFNIEDNTIESDGTSVVTLTFSQNQEGVTIDPGYIGNVYVNGGKIYAPFLAKKGAIPLSEDPSLPQPKEPTSPISTPNLNTTPPPLATNSKPPTVNPSPVLSSHGTIDAYTPKGKKYWSEPVTPPKPQNPPLIEPNEMKLLELQGTIALQLPDGKTPKAIDGMLISSGTTIQAQADSSVAVFIGGVASARFTSNTEGQITHSLQEGVRITTINLKQGCLFAKIGRHQQEKQYFEIQTTQGIAKAQGTDFAALLHENTFNIFVVAGKVALYNSKGNLIGIGTPKKQGEVSFLSTGTTTREQLITLLQNTLELIQKNNTKIQAILNRLAQGKPLTPGEQNYLNLISQIGLEKQPSSSLSPLESPDTSPRMDVNRLMNFPLHNPNQILDPPTTPPATTPI